jgi:histidyl-tRNA synthetase
MQKVKGTRDFYGLDLLQRNYIISLLRDIYEKYNFEQLETPAFENMSLLKNVYGNENEKLLYKILNSGDCFQNVDLTTFNSQEIIDTISKKCLRYDLTLPLIRYVSENKNKIIFPFKRYQIQPVWRADKPQKGRFREFYQCDVDIIGSDFILCEVELIQIIQDLLGRLNIKEYTIKLNHRRILTDFCQLLAIEDKCSDFCCLIDKIDKIGLEKFYEEIKIFNISKEKMALMQNIFTTDLENGEYLYFLKDIFLKNKISTKNIEEIKMFLDKIKLLKVKNKNIKIDFSLARGLIYYTGIIFEVCVKNINIGSIIGGGRYDYFARKLNMPELKGVGFSIGLDRLLVALNELGILKNQDEKTKILFINKDDDFDFEVIENLRREYTIEIYFDKNDDIKKQLKYADKKHFKYVIFYTSEKYVVKNMLTGKQVETKKNNIYHLIS